MPREIKFTIPIDNELDGTMHFAEPEDLGLRVQINNEQIGFLVKDIFAATGSPVPADLARPRGSCTLRGFRMLADSPLGQDHARAGEQASRLEVGGDLGQIHCGKRNLQREIAAPVPAVFHVVEYNFRFFDSGTGGWCLLLPGGDVADR